MTPAREVMTEGSEYLKEDATVTDAAHRLADESIGAVPVCDANGKLRGVVTDRDVVVEVVAAGKDPADTKVIDLVHGEAVTIGADDSVEQAIQTMKDPQVRRLPVIDGDTLVGMISQADLARTCPPETGRGTRRRDQRLGPTFNTGPGRLPAPRHARTDVTTTSARRHSPPPLH